MIVYLMPRYSMLIEPELPGLVPTKSMGFVPPDAPRNRTSPETVCFDAAGALLPTSSALATIGPAFAFSRKAGPFGERGLAMMWEVPHFRDVQRVVEPLLGGFTMLRIALIAEDGTQREPNGLRESLMRLAGGSEISNGRAVCDHTPCIHHGTFR